MFQRVLLFANGDLNDGAAVQLAFQQATVIVAADGGANLARQLGQMPRLTVGDMDSISPAVRAEIEQAGQEVLPFPQEKDETDLELALLEVVRRGATWIRVVGALGGRLDQTLANTYLLSLPVLRDLDVCLVAGAQTIRLLHPGDHAIAGEVGDTISLIPVFGHATQVKTTHLKYALHHETLAFGPARGISNVIAQPQARVRFSEGLLLLVHTIGRA